MVINYLIGDFIYAENKTGVNFYYLNIIKQHLKRKNKSTIKLSTYLTEKTAEKQQEYNLFADITVFGHRFYKYLAYFIPIELIFGKSDVYICDGIVPITIKKSVKIAVVHDLMSIRYPENYSFRQRLLHKLFFRRLKNADYVIAVSKTTKKDLVELLNIRSKKIKVVYNGISIPLDKVRKCERLESICKNKYLFYIGDFRKNKNVKKALDSFRELRTKDSSIKFYLAGNKNKEYTNLYQYVQENNLDNAVKFLGYVTEEEKNYLYQHAFAFIYISEYEGFGVPILEAMANGIPVITSNCSSMKEISGGAAILVNPTSRSEIIDAISSLESKTVRNALVDRGKELVKVYSWEAAFASLEELFNMLDMRKYDEYN